MRIFVSALAILFLSLAAALNVQFAPMAAADAPHYYSCIDGHIVTDLAQCPPVVIHHTPGPTAVGGGGGGGLLGGLLGGLTGGLLAVRQVVGQQGADLVTVASIWADVFCWSYLG